MPPSFFDPFFRFHSLVGLSLSCKSLHLLRPRLCRQIRYDHLVRLYPKLRDDMCSIRSPPSFDIENCVLGFDGHENIRSSRIPGVSRSAQLTCFLFYLFSSHSMQECSSSFPLLPAELYWPCSTCSVFTTLARAVISSLVFPHVFHPTLPS